MAFPFPPDNTQPIPNNPFYYPEGSYLYGPTGPLIVGSGFTINNITGIIEVSGGGSGAPTILAGAGISVTSGVGTVTIANTGIRTVTAGAGISVSVAAGNLNIVNTSPAPSSFGTVTEINTGAGLTGGPITTSGTIGLATTGVAPGTYNNPTITIDSYGRITFASPGSSFSGGITASSPLAVTSTFPQNVSIQAASTTASGAVQLNDTVTSTSTTEAATPNAVKITYDLATQAQNNATSAAASASTALTQAAGATAIANTANTNASNALATALSAQTTATNAQSAAATAQTDATTALAAATAAQAAASSAGTAANSRIPCAAFTGVGQLLVGSGAATFTAFGPGATGRILAANSACATGLEWVPQTTGTVTNIITGSGLTGGPISTTGTIALANTAVTPGTYTNATLTVDAQGRITNAASGGVTGVTQIVAGTNVSIAPAGGTGVVTINASGGLGSVTSVGTGTGLTGGPITSSGTISLDDTTVVPGSYSLASITVDQQGRITAAGSGSIAVVSPIVNTGSASNPTIGIQTATTGQLGAVQVGTNIDVAAGVISVGNSSTSQVGVVELADTAETQAGTDGTLAITPVGAAATYIPCSAFLAKGNLLSATGANAQVALPVGADGQVLTACAAAPTGLCWTSSDAIPCTCITGKGALITGTAANTPTALSVGADGQFLVACSTNLTGLCWAPPPADVPCAAYTAVGDILGGTGPGTFVALPVGADGEVLTACAAATNGLCWASGGGGGGSAATPTTLGTVYACTLDTSTSTAFGYQAEPGGDFNVIIGQDAGNATTTRQSVALGFGSLGNQAAGTFANTAVGYLALASSTTPSQNTAVGWCALGSVNTGSQNVAVGAQAGDSITSGVANVLVGYNAGGQITICNRNTFVGHNAGAAVQNGDTNTFVGFFLGNAFGSTPNCCTAIGSCVRYAHFPSTGTNWSFASDQRLKTGITALPVAGVDFVNTLRPVEFTWVDKETKEPLDGGDHCVVGFIAQDVRKSLQDFGLEHVSNLVSEDAEGYLSMEHTAIIPFLVKAVQELSAKVAELEKKV